jgi:hypothetical protein
VLLKRFDQLQVGDLNLDAEKFGQSLKYFTADRDVKYAQKCRNKQCREHLRILRGLGDGFFVLCVIALSARQITSLNCSVVIPTFKMWWASKQSTCSRVYLRLVEVCIKITPSEYSMNPQTSPLLTT